ncbi:MULTISPECIES: nucleoid-associated protein [unclassified Flavobacterium]|uniref:nucleoid-associated protein n=1 Tax=unclassified Flavobacterium TaxID=196869 RepID=UPI0025BA8F0D|nr:MULTISPECIES: nucleoid-associated protein [unclassified Flavobacterium]
MIDFTGVKLQNITTHFVGNKLRDERIKVSSGEVNIVEGDTEKYLLKYFLSSFQDNEKFNFTNPTELSLNAVYTLIDRIFSNTDSFYENTVELSKHLYESSTHPKINGGEFTICLFENIFLDGIETTAIGLFKTEVKDVFLKFDSTKDNYTIKYENGVNIGKLDKGCIIFDIEAERGYTVCIVDSNKSNDTQYWKDDFLSIRPSADNYHFTKNFLSITKDFVTKQLSEEFEVSKADKIDLLNRSVEYFKSHDRFEKESFEEEVFNNPEMIKSFRSFDEQYRENKNVDVSDNFQISSQAVKKQSRVFKSVLKLDRNFDIYIHGNKDLIEKGMEKDGRKYYKIYYEEEK